MSQTKSNKSSVFKKQLSLSSFLDGNTTRSASINSDTGQKSTEQKNIIAEGSLQSFREVKNVDKNCKSLAYAPVRKQQTTKMLNPIFVDSSSEDENDDDSRTNCAKSNNAGVTRAIVHRYIFDDCSQSPLAPLENKKNPKNTENSIIKPISNGYSIYSQKNEKYSDKIDEHKNIYQEKDYKNGSKECNDRQSNAINGQKKLGDGMSNGFDDVFSEFKDIGSMYEVRSNNSSKESTPKKIISPSDTKKIPLYREYENCDAIQKSKENETVARKPKIIIDTALSDQLNTIEQDSTFKICTKNVSKDMIFLWFF
uniref:Uncharacterized protein n=1 Tax=Bactrocera latifrons TaxID=174628 RepID=A0A0K8VG62_BACLA